MKQIYDKQAFKSAARIKAREYLPRVLAEFLKQYDQLQIAQQFLEESRIVLTGLMKQAKLNRVTCPESKRQVQITSQLRLDWDANLLQKKLPAAYRKSLLKLVPVSDELRLIFNKKNHNLHDLVASCVAHKKRVPVLTVRPIGKGENED